MPESIFKQTSFDILRLHQQTMRSPLATQYCNDCEVHDAIYVTLDGRYHVWLLYMAEVKQPQTGILLIEDEDSHVRLGWVANTREAKQKGNLYNRIAPTLQRKVRRTENKFSQAANACLLELTPQQERLNTDSKDLSPSPHDLVKVLYPATHQLREFAL